MREAMIKYWFAIPILLVSSLVVAGENIKLHKTKYFNKKSCLLKNLTKLSNNGAELLNNGVLMIDNPIIRVNLLNDKGNVCYYFYYEPVATFHINTKLNNGMVKIIEIPGSAMNTSWYEVNYKLDVRNIRLIYKQSYVIDFSLDESGNWIENKIIQSNK
ncbi:MAG: hypothetical protein Q4D68_04295 [Moraxella equi]|nr:hypothetical protein [Moraxella equi]